MASISDYRPGWRLGRALLRGKQSVFGWLLWQLHRLVWVYRRCDKCGTGILAREHVEAAEQLGSTGESSGIGYMSRCSYECFVSDDELEKMPKSKGKTPTAIIGPFSTWWHLWVEPVAVEIFIQDHIAYAITFSEGYKNPWRLEFAGKGKDGLWGGGGYGCKTREELDEYIKRKGLRAEVQLTLDL